MAEQIGKALARVAQPPATASTALSTVDWDRVDLTPLANLPERLDDQQLAVIDQLAALPVPVLAPADEDHFLKCMRTIRLLPGRQDDDLSGELRLNLYRRHFGHYPAAALSYLAERATLELQWFPTPRECKTILDQWKRTDTAYRAVSLARTAARRERQTRLDEARRRLIAGEMTQEEVDALPEGWRSILATEGHLHYGTWALRPRRGGEQEGADPADFTESTTEPGDEAGQPHEREAP